MKEKLKGFGKSALNVGKQMGGFVLYGAAVTAGMIGTCFLFEKIFGGAAVDSETIHEAIADAATEVGAEVTEF